MARSARLGLVLVAVLATAAPARAGTTSVAISGTELQVIGDATGNKPTVTRSGTDLRVADTAQTVAAGAGCTLDTGVAVCPEAGLTHILMKGGDGADELVIDSVVTLPARIEGEAGNDGIGGGGGIDEVYGGDGDDSVGPGYYDTVNGQAAYGGAGNDFVGGAQGDDTIEGGDGDDTMHGYAGADTMRGGAGNDLIQERGGFDLLVDGGAGDDSIGYTDDGAAVYDGGPGYDYADLQGAGYQRGLDITLDGVANDHFGGQLFNVMAIEDLQGSSSVDRLVGSAADERLSGIGADDILEGGGGNDSFYQGFLHGKDVVDGGPGIDIADYVNSLTTCTVTLDGVANDGPDGGDNVKTENVIACTGNGSIVVGDSGPNYLQGWQGQQTLTGGGGNDLLIAGEDNDTLNGGDGEDHLLGDGGTDTLNGDGGDDRLQGGNGPDALNGGDGEDTADYDDSLATVLVTLGAGADDGRDVSGAAGHQTEGDDIRTENLIGTIAADTLTGDGGANRLMGGGKADTLNGLGGDDLLEGGQGGDVLNGGDGSDTADYTNAGSPVSVTLDGNNNDGRVAEADNALVENVLGSSAADILTGDANANRLDGSDGKDTITGAGGDDVLTGGPGEDAIDSGAGADRILARDGEADALTCDAKTGKVVLADALDTSTTCDLTSAESGETAVANEPVGLFGPLDPAIAGSDGTPLSADALAGYLHGIPRSLRARSRTLELGELACACTAKLTLRFGKRRLGAGKATATTSRAVLTARLTAKGWRMLKRKRKVTLTIVVSAGSVDTTVSRTLLIRRTS